MTVVCVRCKRPILWAKTINGYPVPLDAEPHKRGNLRLKPDGTVPVAIPVPKARRADHTDQLYLSHLCRWGKR
jgi:hypothetical protein